MRPEMAHKKPARLKVHKKTQQAKPRNWSRAIKALKEAKLETLQALETIPTNTCLDPIINPADCFLVYDPETLNPNKPLNPKPETLQAQLSQGRSCA